MMPFGVVSGGAPGRTGFGIQPGTILTIKRDVREFQRGDVTYAVASTVNLSGSGSAIADVTAGRPIQLAFSLYRLPPVPGRIIAVRKTLVNRITYTSPAVLFPRVRYQWYAPHPTDLAPYAAVDADHTPEVFGATTWITSGGAAGTTQAVASTTGMVAGDTLRFLVIAGTSVDRTIATVNSATSVTLTATITTTALQRVCKVWPATSGTNPASNNCDVQFDFASGPVIRTPTTENWIWRAEMVEDYDITGTPDNEGPVTVMGQASDRVYNCWYNSRASNAQTEPLWSGASLGTNIAAATFPADPHSGNNLTAGGGANHWGVALDEFLYEVGMF